LVASVVGELNILDAKIEAVKENLLAVNVEEECKYQLESKNKFSTGDQIKILIRPENFRLSLEKDSVNLSRLKGKITQTKYRGALLDYVITLNNGKKVTATLLQNKEGEIYEYQIGMEVFVEWTTGCEVLTK
jgi:spermidine/putrescine transport system ATP-binding protein